MMTLGNIKEEEQVKKATEFVINILMTRWYKENFNAEKKVLEI